jgi:arylsulfatase A-like enzyme
MVCWSSPVEGQAWTLANGAPISPSIESGEDSTIVLRVRAATPVVVRWNGPHGERILGKVKTVKPWSHHLAAFPLPASETGTVSLLPTGTPWPGHRAAGVELSFAEVIPEGRGRCYRDYVRGEDRLREMVSCTRVTVTELPLPARGPRAVAIGTFSTAAGASLQVLTDQGQLVEEIALEQRNVWLERRIDLTSLEPRPERLRLRTETPPGGMVRWHVQLAGGQATADRPNVILYLVDTLRADALGAYGGSSPTPHFDALASEGVLFEQVIAPSPWTLPSVVSLFTGLDVFQHGVAYDQDALANDVTTLAEQFRAAGYTTRAVTASLWVGGRHHTHRGFQELVDISPGQGPWGIRAGTTSADANADILPWLESRPAEPFFLYVHVIDPHQPYTPPEELTHRLVSAEWAPDDRRWKHARMPSEGRTRNGRSAVEIMGPEQRAPIIEVAQELYAAAVVHCDTQFGRLMSTLERTGLRERTLMVLTADHGEEFFEHRLTGHSHSLYAEMVRVPLIVSRPASRPPGTRVAEPVGLVDLARTISRMAGIGRDAGFGGADLTPLMSGSGDSRQTDRPLLLQRRPQGRSRPIEGIPEMDAIVAGGWKLIRNLGRSGRPHQELFSLAGDPGDAENRAGRAPDAAKLLNRVLDRALATSGRSPSAEAGELDEETLERLRALGYAE